MKTPVTAMLKRAVILMEPNMGDPPFLVDKVKAPYRFCELREFL
jgi:hypothetical protein